jgi:micrococcal nuclease
VKRVIINSFISLVLLFGVLGLGCPDNSPFQSQPSSRTQAELIRVIDGDTIEVLIGWSTYSVRYIGIDTPERGEDFYYESTEKNRELLQGQTLWLEKDVSETDRYGRLLRYVYAGNTFVNAELVRLGYAQVATYPPDVKHIDYFLELQKAAREHKLGLWANPDE